MTSAPAATFATVRGEMAVAATLASTTMELLSRLAPIPCRDDIATAAETTFRKLGRAAEVGVFEGAFAAHNLQRWSGQYWMIDAWEMGSNVVNPKDLAHPLSSGAFDQRKYDKAIEGKIVSSPAMYEIISWIQRP